MRRRRFTDFLRVFLTPALFAFAFACSRSALDPELPDGTLRFTPPAVYNVWWSMASECSGRTGALSAVEWFLVPGVAEFEHEGRKVSGYWSRVSNRVVVAEKAMLDGPLIRHEMLHALEHNVGHPRQAFLQRCGGVVVCITSCISEAGQSPPPRAGLARVRPEDMDVGVLVDPGAPGRATDDGHFRLTVTVRNPRADSVVVLLPSMSDGAPPPSFRFEVHSATLGLWYQERAWDSGSLVFAPGQVRRVVYDFTMASKFNGLRALPPDTYSVLGGFGPASSAVRSFDLK